MRLSCYMLAGHWGKQPSPKISPVGVMLPHVSPALVNGLAVPKPDLHMGTCQRFTCQPLPHTPLHNIIYCLPRSICSFVYDNQDDIGKLEEDLELGRSYLLLSQHSPHELKSKRQGVTSLMRKTVGLVFWLGNSYCRVLFFLFFWLLIPTFFMPNVVSLHNRASNVEDW